jgi:hypothetical protein
LEAWRTVSGDGIGAVGEWVICSKGYAEEEWAASGKQWLQPSSQLLPPGGTRVYALAFSLATDVRSKNDALVAVGAAVVQGVPGYVLGEDMQDASLLVKPPAGATLVRAASDSTTLIVGDIVAKEGGWAKVSLLAKASPAASPAAAAAETSSASSALSVSSAPATPDNRPRLLLTYSDGSTHVVNYLILPSFASHLASYV